MKKLLILVAALFVLISPFKVFALSQSYEDKIYDTVKAPVEDNKINIYLFHRETCPHCKEEIAWLETVKIQYKDLVNIYYYEVSNDKENAKLLDKVKKEQDVDIEGVPLTFIGKNYFVGFSDIIKSRMESKIKEYLELDKKEEVKENNVDIPILGNVNMKEVSLPVVAIILGFIDGFNPCAMWILLFLISLLFTMKDKKKAWFLGFTFLFISALVYFISMLGINFVVSIVAIEWIKKALAIFILVAGILNFRKYLKQRKEEAGCSVVDAKKRKKLITKMKNIINSNSFILALIGIIALAASVNLIELACSLGFPLIFTEMLSINNVVGITKIIYLIIYIFFYMIDDLVVFTISMVSLEATGVTNKYNKLCTLVSAIIMIIMGILLIIKPEWLMLNF